MSEETAKLQRDNTMVATAKEGEAFLEGKGKVDEDAKTRSQQKEIEETKSTEEENAELRRTRTMAETAKEGKEILDGEELGKTRSQTESEKNGKETEAPEENGKNKDDKEEPEKLKEPDAETNGDSAEDEKSPLKRAHAKEETVKEDEEIVKKQKVDKDSEGGEQEVKS